MKILLIISIISGIIAIIGAIITKRTDRFIGGRWYENSIFWFYFSLTFFSVCFWSTIILGAWFLVSLEVGG